MTPVGRAAPGSQREEVNAMDHPVHHYRGYEILCSHSGYTILQGGIEVLSMGTGNADNALANCESTDDFLPHAKLAIDKLIGGRA